MELSILDNEWHHWHTQSITGWAWDKIYLESNSNAEPSIQYYLFDSIVNSSDIQYLYSNIQPFKDEHEGIYLSISEEVGDDEPIFTNPGISPITLLNDQLVLYLKKVFLIHSQMMLQIIFL